MRIVIASMLAVLLLGGSVTAQSPEASQAPPSNAPAASVPVAPVTSPAASSAAPTLPGVKVKVDAVSRSTCPTNATCSWYLTFIGGSLPGEAFVTPMAGLPNTAGTRTVLTPALSLPSPLGPGTYLVEASSWIQADIAATKPPKAKLIGRSASCAAILTVSADGNATTAHLGITFRKDYNGCAIAILYSETDIDDLGN